METSGPQAQSSNPIPGSRRRLFPSSSSSSSSSGPSHTIVSPSPLPQSPSTGLKPRLVDTNRSGHFAVLYRPLFRDNLLEPSFWDWYLLKSHTCAPSPDLSLASGNQLSQGCSSSERLIHSHQLADLGIKVLAFFLLKGLSVGRAPYLLI